MQALHQTLNEDNLYSLNRKELAPEHSNLTRKWNRTVLVTSALASVLSLIYLALSISAVVVIAVYNNNYCSLQWAKSSGFAYLCGQDHIDDVLLASCHLLVSTLLLPTGLGFAIAGSIRKLSFKSQIICTHVAINMLVATFVASFLLMICSLKMVSYAAVGSGVVFAVCTICTAVLVPVLVKKIAVTPRNDNACMKSAGLEEAN